MALQLNGACEVKMGLGSSSALVSLGWSTPKGVEWEPQEQTEPVYTDRGGPKIAWDHQLFGVDGIIAFELIDWTDSSMQLLRGRLSGGVGGTDATALTLAAQGTLVAAAGNLFRTLLTSPTAAVPWNFLQCKLEGAYPVNLGTRVSSWKLRIYTYAAQGAATLYNRTTTG